MWAEYTHLVLSGLSILVAALLLVFVRGRAATAFLAVFVGLWGVLGVQFSLMELGVWPGGGWWSGENVHFTGISLFMGSAIVAFALVYPDITVTPWRRNVIIGLFVISGLITIWMIIDPGAWIVDSGPTLLFTITNLARRSLQQVATLAFLGWRWLRSPPGTYRTMVIWGLLPFVFWGIHDTLGFWLLPAFLGPRFGLDGLLPNIWVFLVNAPQFLAFAGIFGLWLVSCSRLVRGVAAQDDRALAFIVLFLLPVTLIQVFDPVFVTGTHGPLTDTVSTPLWYHFLLDHIPVAIIAYGVARHHVVGLDLRFKWTLRKSTLVGLFIGVFFVSAQVTQAFLTTEYGWAVGGVIAGLLLLVINPLQRLTDRIADTALPRVQDTAEYRLVRKNEVYGAAVEAAVMDGTVTDKERDVLAALAEQLALKPTEARGIERRVLQTLQLNAEGVAA